MLEPMFYNKHKKSIFSFRQVVLYGKSSDKTSYRVLWVPTTRYHIHFAEGFIMCVGNENKSISDSDLRNTLINSIMKLSKDKQKIVIEEAKRLGFFN